MILVLCPVTDAAVLTAARATSTSMLLSRHLHMFSLPKSMDSLVVDRPVAGDQCTIDSLRTKAGTLPSKKTHLLQQTNFINRPKRSVTLRAAGLAKHTTGTTL